MISVSNETDIMTISMISISISSGQLYMHMSQLWAQTGSEQKGIIGTRLGLRRERTDGEQSGTRAGEQGGNRLYGR